MDFADLRAQLDHEFALLRAAVVAAPADARVPTCPDWTAADLAGHVAEVYRHKAVAIRLNAWPKPWPPERPAVAPEEDLDLAYAELVEQLDAHSPADPASTTAEVAGCAARAEGNPASLLLWLWNRVGDEAVTLTGDAGLLAQFRELRVVGTQ